MRGGGRIKSSEPDSVVWCYLGEALICGHSVHLNEAALFDVALFVFVWLVEVQIEGLLQDKSGVWMKTERGFCLSSAALVFTLNKIMSRAEICIYICSIRFISRSHHINWSRWKLRNKCRTLTRRNISVWKLPLVLRPPPPIPPAQPWGWGFRLPCRCRWPLAGCCSLSKWTLLRHRLAELRTERSSLSSTSCSG